MNTPITLLPAELIKAIAEKYNLWAYQGDHVCPSAIHNLRLQQFAQDISIATLTQAVDVESVGTGA